MCVAYVYLWYEWLAALLQDLLPRTPLGLNPASLALVKRSRTRPDLKSLRRHRGRGEQEVGGEATAGESKLNQAMDAGSGPLLRQPLTRCTTVAHSERAFEGLRCGVYAKQSRC